MTKNIGKKSDSDKATADKPASAEASAGEAKKSKKEIVIMIVAAIMLLLAGVLIGWAFLSVDEVEEKTENKQTEEETLEPVDPYTDWLTYTNEDGGYQFKYPTSWEVESSPAELDSPDTQEYAVFGPKGYKEDRNSGGDYVMGNVQIPNFDVDSIDDYMETNYQFSSQKNILEKKEEITIDGDKGYKYRIKGGDRDFYTIVVAVEHENSLYLIHLNPGNVDPEDDMFLTAGTVFNGILETFEFIEKSSEVTVSEPTTVDQDFLYENDYMTITIPAGWSYGEAYRTVLVDGVKKREKSDAINVTKGKYILYINPNTSQTSGAEGGRFSEIAMGAPGVELIQKMHPAEPCGDMETRLISKYSSRTDLYANDKPYSLDVCNTTNPGQEKWYFSFDSDYVSNGVSYYGTKTFVSSDATTGTDQYVITMTYDADTIDELPDRDDENNKAMIEEMTDIVLGLILK